jgi:hypothetical protein
MVENVLRSSMKCLYSQKCINYTILYGILLLPSDIKFFPYSLNITENSSYTINTTFSQLLDNLMIETWGQNISHRNYFQSCKPLRCTYPIIGRRELIYIITTLFGIIGGLNTILEIIVPRLVSIIMKIINRNKVLPRTNHFVSN